MIHHKKPCITPLNQWRQHYNMPKATPEHLARLAGQDVVQILAYPPKGKDK